MIPSLFLTTRIWPHACRSAIGHHLCLSSCSIGAGSDTVTRVSSSQPRDQRKHGQSTHVTTPGRSRNMAAIRRTDTQPELALRSALHRAGLRFRKDLRLECGGMHPRPDIVFTRAKVAVFVDGCFWHSCPEHSNPPTSNPDYWGPKLARNAQRDQQHDAALVEAGWTVIRIWEHEDVAAAAHRIALAVRRME
ncbi:very short patch repair endonuclease [Oryzobacter sp. R7]|uniref:very short patch repair endonuclease n=1 Tax=Oryzobacter faecalis TaxID=3388656 RepID=UPI00398D3794